MNSFYSQYAGCTVRWQDLPGSGEPVVFIHGLGCASSYEYPRIVCDARFGARRAILIDLPGSGYSDKPTHYGYRTSEQAQVVAELLNHLKLDTFWLYGHSMGGSIAIEAADVVLMSGNLQAVPTAIGLSTATINNIRQNLFWAFVYNAALIPVAAGALYPMFGILLSPIFAAAAMALSSVFVISNALRLKRYQPTWMTQEG